MTSTAAKRKSKESKTSNNELSSSTSSINPISSRLRSTKQISVEGPNNDNKPSSSKKVSLPIRPRNVSSQTKKNIQPSSSSTKSVKKKKNDNNVNEPDEHSTRDASKLPINTRKAKTKQTPTLQAEPKTNISTGTQTSQAWDNDLVMKLTIQISEQDFLIQTLKERILSLEEIIAVNKNTNRQLQASVPAPPAVGDSRKFTCYIIGDSHVRGLSEKLSELLSPCCST